MRKNRFRTSVTLMICTLLICNNLFASELKYTGLMLTPKEIYDKIPVVPISRLQNSPIRNAIMSSSGNAISGSVMLMIPPAGHQLFQNSCGAWAAGYSASSILAYNKYQNWDEAKRSAAFLFNYIHLDNCNGSYMIDACRILNTVGVCSEKLMPYDWTECDAPITNEQKFDAALHTVDYYRLNNTTDVDEIKSVLYNGYPVVVGFEMRTGFEECWYEDGSFIWDDLGTLTGEGAHAVCIVGYDDSRQMFKVLNSYGYDSPDGCFWVTYDLVRQRCFHEGYVLTNMNQSKYPTGINGLLILCKEETYTVENLPDGATVKWGYVGDDKPQAYPPVVIESTNGASATYKRGVQLKDEMEQPPFIGTIIPTTSATEPYVGTVTITATVTLNGSTYTLKKDVEMTENIDLSVKEDKQTDPMKPIAFYMAGTSVPLSLVHPIDKSIEASIMWQCSFTPATGTMDVLWAPTLYGNSVSIQIPSGITGTINITVTNLRGCANIEGHKIKVMSNIMYIDFTNPASGNVDVSVKETAAGTQEGVAAMSADAEVYAEPYMGEYRLELWHEVYGMVREMDVEAGNPTVTMNLGGLTPGWYYVRLIADGEMKAVGKLMVR